MVVYRTTPPIKTMCSFILHRKKQLEDGDYEETGDLVEIEELEKKEKEEAVEKNKFQKIEHQILSPAEAKSHLASESSFYLILTELSLHKLCITSRERLIRTRLIRSFC